MKKIILSLTALIFSANSFASYLESCHFDAEVLSVQKLHSFERVQSNPRIALLSITGATDQGSHVEEACASHVGTTKVMNLTDSEGNRTLLVEGERIQLEYFYVNGMSPQGLAESTSYSILD